MDDLDRKPASGIMTGGSARRLATFLLGNKPFLVVWLALFVAIAGIGMVSPLLPKFAKDMGASGIWVGLAFSGFAISQIPLMPVVGRLSDTYGKKPFLWIGLMVYAMAAMGYFWSPGYIELISFRLLSGVGAAMAIPTAFAYVGELAPEGQEGRYMALFNIALIAGFGIGPLLGGMVSDHFGMDATYISMAILSIVASGTVLLLLPGRPGRPQATESSDLSISYLSTMRDEAMRGVIVFQFVLGLSFGAVLAFLPIFMTEVRDSTLGQVGIVISVRFIVNGTLAYPFGWMADRGNRATLVSIGTVVMAAGMFLIPWVGGFVHLVALFIAMGTFESMAMPAVSAIAVDRGRILGMGSVMGVFNMSMSAAMVVGSLVGGVVEGSIGVDWVFRCAAFAAIAGLLIFNIFMRRAPQST